jgi:uncharacterized protein (TIGR02145 family)
MSGFLKKNRIIRIILAAVFFSGFLLCFILSCEIFDYERIIIIQTGSPTNESCNSAEITGQILDLGESNIVQHGHCWSTNPENLNKKSSLGARASRGSFTSTLQDLSPDTKYYIKAYATDANGKTVYGDENSFKTIAGSQPEALFSVSATTIAAGGGVQFFDESLHAPTRWTWHFGDGGSSTLKDPFHTYMSEGLYTVELTVSNDCGSDTEVKPDYIWVHTPTTDKGTFVDSRDSHEYKWVRIGEQVWMAENLAYLPAVNTPADYSPTEPRYYVYEYLLSDVNEAKSLPYYSTYGVLYNWPAAIQSCPAGWHLPNEDEWQLLINTLGGEYYAGGALKEAGTEHWIYPNTGATNSSEFTGLPGGTYLFDVGGYFFDEGYYGYLWSSDEGSSEFAYLKELYNEDAYIFTPIDYKQNGNSVRCIQDGGTRKKQTLQTIQHDTAILKHSR